MTGQFVTSKAGHDRGTLYIVVVEEGEYVWLSDGRRKNPDRPKKKNRKHIQPINASDVGIREKLMAGETVRPEEIKFAIRQFSENQSIKK
ncbi:MAG: KOW domain-containing RNA-binding protein [bacterium]|nr:KOW domain-containing RNA-binding protein [bacterium]